MLYPRATGGPQAYDLEEIRLGVLLGFDFVFVGILWDFKIHSYKQSRSEPSPSAGSVTDFQPNRFERLYGLCLTEADLEYCPRHYLFTNDLRCLDVLDRGRNPRE